MNVVNLDVGGRVVKSTEITYDDLLILYQQFVDKYGFVPRTTECTSKYNMPQMRIIQRVLSESDVTYNDLMNRFGKVSHVRTESKDYDAYLRRFQLVSRKLDHAPTKAELMNNSFGLPSGDWFVKYCPDPSVHSYDQFVQWCGHASNKIKHWTKEELSPVLIEYQEILGRPIKREDINAETIGISMIVINRLYGGLDAAKAELGLLPTPPNQPQPFEYYRELLTNIISVFMRETGRDRITWRDIESGLYGVSCTHKTLMKSFQDAGVDLFGFIKSLGCEMSDDAFSYKYTFEDGERVRSSMEYDFTQYLRSLGYRYKIDYERDVKYKKFIDIKSKIDCDYVLHIGDHLLFVEIAGIIFRPPDCDFSEYQYSGERQNIYRDKLAFKRKVLDELGADYLFFFFNDMADDSYMKIFEDHIAMIDQ